MASINAFTGVGVAGMSRTLHVAEAAAAAAAHPAFWAYAAAGAAAVIPPQRKRRTATATGQSVDRGTT
jgi:predicted MFS family arabinose efflux permease